MEPSGSRRARPGGEAPIKAKIPLSEIIPHRDFGIPDTVEVRKAIGLPAADDNHMPLHVKDVTPINLVALDRMAEKVRMDLASNYWKARKLLHDERLYQPLAERKPNQLKMDLTKADLDLIRAYNQIEDHPATEAALGWLRLFTVPEPAKNRRRVIAHTTTANEMERQIKLLLNTMKQMTQAVHAGPLAFAVDFQQFFAIFELDPAIRKYFCFVNNEGRTMRYTRLAMGFSGACDIAHTALMVILAHIQNRVKEETGYDIMVRGHIDNALFIGNRIALTSACAHLEAVLVELGAKLNEGSTREEFEKLISDEVAFVGTKLNFSNKTVAVSDNVVTKSKMLLQFAIENMKTKPEANKWPAKYVACVYGLANFWHCVCRETRQLGIAPFWALSRRYIELMRELQSGKTKWEQNIPLTLNIQNDMVALLTRIGANEASWIPRKLESAADNATHVMMADSSKREFAALLLELATGKFHFYHDFFPEELRRSCDAEPRAITLAIRKFRPLLRDARLFTITDHSGFEGAWRKGTSGHPPYNQAIMAAKSAQIEIGAVRHISGSKMPMDDPSRGKELDMTLVYKCLREMGFL